MKSKNWDRIMLKGLDNFGAVARILEVPLKVAT